jgi:tRNA(Ile)-lysidine synthase
MRIDIPPGKYVVAVSGGVDSMVLLDILRRNPEHSLIVAHFNHGIRTDSKDDESLVRSIALKHSLVYKVGYGKLGKGASEELARKARYKFLEYTRDENSARAIITAHHQDDLIETAFINMLRGSGHRGLVSIKLNTKVLRPLLNFPKQELVNYAKEQKLTWREDITNNDETYLRNYIRNKLMPRMTAKNRSTIIKSTDKIVEIVAEKEHLTATISQSIIRQGRIDRVKYIVLPQEVRHELLMYWLRGFNFNSYDRKAIGKLDIFIKTGLPGSRYPVKKSLWLLLQLSSAQFILRT